MVKIRLNNSWIRCDPDRQISCKDVDSHKSHRLKNFTKIRLHFLSYPAYIELMTNAESQKQPTLRE